MSQGSDLAGLIEMGYMTNGLTFNTLREANLQRLPEMKNRKGLPAHSEPDGSDWSIAEWLQAVVGELGELANILKKVKRGDFTKEEVHFDIASELADVQTYLDILSMRLGVDLGEATMRKWNEVSKRVGSKLRIDAEDWHRVQ